MCLFCITDLSESSLLPTMVNTVFFRTFSGAGGKYRPLFIRQEYAVKKMLTILDV